jgi:Ulp1 family protease
MQNNEIDCGVFVMKYAEMFCANPPEDMETFLSTLPKWFSLDAIPQKRLEVKNLLLRLFAESKADISQEEESVHEKEENSAHSNTSPHLDSELTHSNVSAVVRETNQREETHSIDNTLTSISQISNSENDSNINLLVPTNTNSQQPER